MNAVPLPTRGPECPPAMELEALAVEGHSPHVDGCEHCRGYVEALRVEISAYSKSRPFEMFEAKLQRRPAPSPRRWPLLFAVPVAVALAAVVVTLPPPDGVHEKGKSPLSVLLHRTGESPLVVRPDQRVTAGDTLKFSFEAPRDGHLLVLSLDGREHAAAVFPYGGETSIALSAGSHVLEGSVELDAAPGPEWVVAVFSNEPLQAAPLLEQLKGQALRATVQLSCEGCRVYALRLKKD